MKNENKRYLYLKVRVSQEEMNAIKCEFQHSGMNTLQTHPQNKQGTENVSPCLCLLIYSFGFIFYIPFQV